MLWKEKAFRHKILKPREQKRPILQKPCCNDVDEEVEAFKEKQRLRKEVLSRDDAEQQMKLMNKKSREEKKRMKRSENMLNRENYQRLRKERVQQLRITSKRPK